ncbi:DUF4339 domain-containing protein [Prochlorothrix hollandica]|uniref:DUF4339 domain-containing protein n=1 Tax=Prochlorothrix hollandica TaxID=1223 RepID=UPI00334061CE
MNKNPIWFHAHNSEKIGPLRLEEMQDLILSGQIGRDTLVWKSSLSTWIPLRDSDLSEFLEAHTPPDLSVPPPLPVGGKSLRSTSQAPAPSRFVRKIQSQNNSHKNNLISFLFSFSSKRSIGSAMLFYLCQLLMLVVVLGILGVPIQSLLASNLGIEAAYQISVIIGIVVAVIYTTALVIVIVQQRRLSSSFYLILIISVPLSMILGGLGGLIPASILLIVDD